MDRGTSVRAAATGPAGGVPRALARATRPPIPVAAAYASDSRPGPVIAGDSWQVLDAPSAGVPRRVAALSARPGSAPESVPVRVGGDGHPRLQVPPIPDRAVTTDASRRVRPAASPFGTMTAMSEETPTAPEVSGRPTELDTHAWSRVSLSDGARQHPEAPTPAPAASAPANRAERPPPPPSVPPVVIGRIEVNVESAAAQPDPFAG
ncbi:MAG: hypothetical protein ABI083_05395, partial [Lapillicoccus sp.]